MKGTRRWPWEERTRDLPVRGNSTAVAMRPKMHDKWLAGPSSTIPVARPYIWGNELRYVSDAIKADGFPARGPYVTEFEDRFRHRVGRTYALSVTNGTAAVHLALVSLGVGPGDEVIVPDFCMVAPIFAVLYCGATPVPIDVDNFWNLDPELISHVITDRTKAILVVHNYGHPAAMSIICRIAEAHGIPVVEDAAEALGATVAGRHVGTFGRIACYSFYANKTITTGEGGMITTDDPHVYERAKWKRDMCFGRDQENRFLHAEVGFNYRMTNLQAAVGLAQLEHVDEAVRRKIEIASQYSRELEGIIGLSLPPTAEWATNVFWVYGILIDEGFGISRAALQVALGDRGIETRRFFSPVTSQPFLKKSAKMIDCPRSSFLARVGLYLPSFIGITALEIQRVTDAIRSIQGHNATNM